MKGVRVKMIVVSYQESCKMTRLEGPSYRCERVECNVLICFVSIDLGLEGVRFCCNQTLRRNVSVIVVEIRKGKGVWVASRRMFFCINVDQQAETVCIAVPLSFPLN